MSFNKITIVGNLGRDPELRYTPHGTAVCNLNVATTEKKRGKSGEYEQVTTWFRVTLWGNQAENASRYLEKGSPVYVHGSLTMEEWTDREGNNRVTLNVNAIDMQFIGGNGRGRQEEEYDGDVESGSDEGVDDDADADDESPAPPKARAAKAAAGKAKPPEKKPAGKKKQDDIPF
ncbi:MAG: single-stranded DNA-binding protein [Pyrinomonadaceae bacterium]